MRLRRALFVAVVTLLGTAACRQPDGALPQETPETSNRLHDLQRDLLSVAAGEADGPKDFADDLAVFADEPEGVSAARTLAGSVSVVVLKRSLNDDALKQLTTVLWKAVASRELSQRQVDAIKDDLRGTLVAIGVSQSDANVVAERLGQTQKAVTHRTRH